MDFNIFSTAFPDEIGVIMIVFLWGMGWPFYNEVLFKFIFGMINILMQLNSFEANIINIEFTDKQLNFN